jgi:ABC-2 type transport system ATP-binding protein
MTPDTDAIRSFLNYGDHSLAVRRMLDQALDTGDQYLVQDTIQWSRGFTKNQPSGAAPPASFFTEADTLLGRIALLNAGSFKAVPLLRAQQLQKKYKHSNFALHPISLHINTGDILGVVGENGNGKTTLLSCLAGQLAIDSGSIDFTKLYNPDYYTIKNHVAFIPQRIPVWYGLLKDNLHFSASLAGVTGEENSLMVDFMLERLNLGAYAHLTWKQISSGYRTRFEIARILLQKPSLLILDEPLANLDINAQQTLLTDLRYLAKSVHHPLGIILSSQQLHEVEKVADTVLLIKQGKCIHRTNEANKEEVSYAIEVESLAEREVISNIAGANVQVQYNGGFYTLTSRELTAKQLLKKLTDAEIEIRYFRDITHSTKRYF